MKSCLKIKELAKRKGLTLNDLAKKMDINRVTLSNIINGNPTVSTLSKIAESLNVPVSELFSVEEDNMSKELKWDFIRKEFVFLAFDENVSLNATFNKTYINFSLRIKSKDFEILSSLAEKKEFFEELLTPSLNVRNFLVKVITNGTFTIHILSLETNVSLLELESIIKAIELFRYSYLSEQYGSYFVQFPILI
jgi:regulatory protein